MEGEHAWWACKQGYDDFIFIFIFIEKRYAARRFCLMLKLSGILMELTHYFFLIFYFLFFSFLLFHLIVLTYYSHTLYFDKYSSYVVVLYFIKPCMCFLLLHKSYMCFNLFSDLVCYWNLWNVLIISLWSFLWQVYRV